MVPTLHMSSVYALLSEYPGAKQIAKSHLTRLSNLLETASKGRHRKSKAIEIRDAARQSIGSVMSAKSLELQHTISLIRELDIEIDEIEDAIREIVDGMNTPLLTIPGIGYRISPFWGLSRSMETASFNLSIILRESRMLSIRFPNR